MLCICSTECVPAIMFGTFGCAVCVSELFGPPAERSKLYPDNSAANQEEKMRLSMSLHNKPLVQDFRFWCMDHRKLVNINVLTRDHTNPQIMEFARLDIQTWRLQVNCKQRRKRKEEFKITRKDQNGLQIACGKTAAHWQALS